MSNNDDIKALLVEIRDNQRLALARQEEHLEIAKAQVERARAQTEEAIALQKNAVARFARVSRIVLPLIVFCVVVVVVLLVRVF